MAGNRIRPEDLIDVEGFSRLEAEIGASLKNIEKAVKSLKATVAEENKGTASLQSEIVAQYNAQKQALNGVTAETVKGRRQIDEMAKAMASGLESSRKLSQAFKENVKTVKLAEDSYKSIKNRLRDAKEEFELLSQSQDPKKFEQQTLKVARLEAELKRLRDTTKGYEKSLGGINEAINAQSKTYNEIRAKIKNLKSTLGTLEVDSQSYQRVEAALNRELQKEIDLRSRQPSLFQARIQSAIRESREIQKLNGKLQDLREQLTKEPDTKMFNTIQREIRQTEAAIDRLSRQQASGSSSFFQGAAGSLNSAFALGGAAGAGAALAASGVQALQGAYSELASEVREAYKQLKLTQSITQLSGKTLDDLTASLRATSKTFDLDFNETLRAANALSKEFGITQQEALRQINQGLAQGANLSGDYLDNLREYAQVFINAGFSLEEFNRLNIRSAQLGLFNDKAPDAIKEIALRLGDLTPAQKKVLDGLGAIGTQIQETFARSKSDGILLLLDTINELEAAGKNVQPIISNLGGGPLEDLGRNGRLAAASIRSTAVEMTNAEKATLGVLKAQDRYEQELVKLSNTLGATGTSFDKFWIDVKAFGVRLVNGFILYFNKAANVIRGFQLATELSFSKFLNALWDATKEGFTRIFSGDLSGAKNAISKLAKESSKTFSVIFNAYLAKNKIIDKELAEKEAEQLGKAMGEKTAKSFAQAVKKQRVVVEAVGMTDTASNPFEVTDNPYKKQLSEKEKAEKEFTDWLKAEMRKRNRNTQRAAQEELDILNEKLEAMEAETAAKYERINEVVSYSTQFASQLFSGYIELRRAQYEIDLAFLEEKQAHELEMTGNNEAAKRTIERRYDTEKRSIMRKQARDEKLNALFSIAINTASAVAEALPNLILAGIVGGIGAAQAALVLAKPLPKFKDGVFDLKRGENPPGIDTIPALLNEGESVVTTEATQRFPNLTKALVEQPDGESLFQAAIKDGVLSAYIDSPPPAAAEKPAEKIDYNKMAEAFYQGASRVEKPFITVDERGFHIGQMKKGNRITRLNQKFKPFSK